MTSMTSNFATDSENGSVSRLRREKCKKNANPEKMRIRMLLFNKAN